MHWFDWTLVAIFCLISLLLGLCLRRVGSQSLEAYFVSNRTLGWWLAGTSMAATAFSSDTPLLITSMVRRRGLWGCWEVWALGLSSMLAVFVFSKLWKRTSVTTEVELVELRYSGKPAAFLRGFKALYWGLLYNCFIIGVWPVTGMTKVLQETTGLNREASIIGCVLLGACYTSLSGLWGVVLTDAFQFVWAMIGAGILAFYAVGAVGGLKALSHQLSASTLAILPPGPSESAMSLLESPFGWFLGLMLVQWWAWKNTDGGGVLVQRLVSCKNERHAMLSVLWFSIAHYCLRSWPWVLTALASLVLIPDTQLVSVVSGDAFIDHERAYPRLITQLLPLGMRGILVASFFAAFLSTLSTQLNWGASYLLYDGYKRFLKPRACERHYLFVARLLPWLLALLALIVAWFNQSIGSSFTGILNLTAGIGPVYLLRWFWWRINPWSEIAAMTVSLPVLLARPYVLEWLGWPQGSLIELLFMVVACAIFWLPITLGTAPVAQPVLKRFYDQVHPPGFWGIVAHPKTHRDSWRLSLIQWIIASGALLATTIGPLQLMLTGFRSGWLLCAAALGAWAWVLIPILRTRDSDPIIPIPMDSPRIAAELAAQKIHESCS